MSKQGLSGTLAKAASLVGAPNAWGPFSLGRRIAPGDASSTL